jgi:hypothetical protein
MDINQTKRSLDELRWKFHGRISIHQQAPSSS